MFKRFKQWKLARVRALSLSSFFYIRFTPNFGFGFPLGRSRRLRFAAHHGLQLVVWRGERWVVGRQLFGRSTVRGERHVPKLALGPGATLTTPRK